MADELERTRQDAARSGPTAAVVLVAGEGTLATHAIGGPQLVIGRAPDCDIPVRHAALSRHHAVVRLGPPLTVQDLGSTNGTRVARELRIKGEPVAIQLGESFQIGPFSFVVLDAGPAERSRSAIREVIRVDDPTPAGVPAMIRDIATSATSVLVLGETGVGKEILSQTLHQLSGRTGACLRINCAALAESLLESELFGHEKGAFTGAGRTKIGLIEAASGGTVFLDEIGELAPTLQAKLLRVLEAGELTRVGAVQPIAIDVRFIAATHRDLVAEVAAGRFRADLFYRLDGVSLQIPPLRERRGAIIPLALQFIAAAQAGRPTASPVSAAFLACLEAHDWPGNVRELKATVERAVLIAAGKPLAPSHVVLSRRVAPAAPVAPVPDAVVSADPELDPAARAERARIIAALDACSGNQTRAARQLGISRSTLVSRLALYRVPRPRTRGTTDQDD